MAEKQYIEQMKHTQEYLIPYFEKHIPDFREKQVLEVGCAEGGFLTTLRQIGINGIGLELESSRVKLALEKDPELEIITGDITNPELITQIDRKFDLIVLRDVIEHIPNRDILFENLRKLLSTGGFIFISFPPRFSPFGGHQQNGRSLIRKLPYLQIWAPFLIRIVGKLFNEFPFMIDHIIHNFKIGLTISRFERMTKNAGLFPSVKGLFLFRPIFRLRFGLKPRTFPNLPILREIFVTGCEVLLQDTAERWRRGNNE